MSALKYIFCVLLLLVQHNLARNYVCGLGFRSISDYQVEDNACTFNPSYVQDNSVIFIKTDYLEFFFTTILPQIRHRIILITHNSDYSVPGRFIHYLEDPRIIMWFGQNGDCSAHPKFTPIPIGIANPRWAHGNPYIFDKVIDAIELKKTQKKACRLYINFGDTHPIRSQLRHMFTGRSFAVFGMFQSLEEYLLEMSQYQYVLSPFGNGLDSHRTWEALLVGSIPIVKTSTLDPLYENLPVIIVQNWADITSEFLAQKHHKMAQKNYSTEKLYMDYWIRLIMSYKK